VVGQGGSGVAGLVPHGAEGLTSSWLSAALQRDCRITAVSRTGEAYGFAGDTYRVHISGLDGPSVVVKLWDTAGIANDREVHFYRELAPTAPIRLAACYFGAVDAAELRAVLVLEDLAPLRQGDVMVAEASDSLRQIVAAVAAIHAHYWGDRTLDGTEWLLDATGSRRTSEWFASRRYEFLDRFGPVANETAAWLFGRLPEANAAGSSVLGGSESTLLHADLHLDNIVFVDDGTTPILLDWAMCGRGPAVLDLAEIVFQMAPGEAVAGLVRHYVAELRRYGLEGVTTDEVMEQLGGALLWKFATWTLGVARWYPTSERGKATIRPMLDRAEEAVATWDRIRPGWLKSQVDG